MLKILLLGEHHALVLPEWAEREELAIAYADLIRRVDQVEGATIHPQLLRVYSAAIGLSIPRIGRRAKEADARTDYLKCGCMPLEYGGRVYGFLRGAGASPTEIQDAGLRCLEAVGNALAPRQEEVEASANFTGAAGAPLQS